MKLFLVIVSIILCVEEALCFSAGVPNLPEVCKRMTPRHGKYKPQTSEAPYEVTVEPSTVAGGETVSVTLRSTGDLKFKGFYLQGRGEKGTPIGTFTANKLADTHSCSGIRWNAAHHASGKVEKTDVQITWQAPRDYEGEVNFLPTGQYVGDILGGSLMFSSESVEWGVRSKNAKLIPINGHPSHFQKHGLVLNFVDLRQTTADEPGGTFVHTYVQIWTGVYSNPLTVTKGNGTRTRSGPGQTNYSFGQILQNFLNDLAFRRNS